MVRGFAKDMAKPSQLGTKSKSRKLICRAAAADGFVRHSTEKGSRYFQNASKKPGLCTIYHAGEDIRKRKQVKTPAALIPDEGVHFVYFVFGGLVGAPHLFGVSGL